MKYLLIAIFMYSSLLSCNAQPAALVAKEVELTVGAAQFDHYLSLLSSKKVGIVANATSTVDSIHLVDTLLALGVNIKKVFAPEHGFRGDHGAGDKVSDSKDQKTGLPLLSLYGKTKKPTSEMMSGIDIMIFDIQDVGARFYTYISTMHYVMEACAEAHIPLLVLDRPNPNGFYVDGPVLEKEFSSFVGMHPIPVVHGCTIAELALMINGEHWLKNGVQCDLTTITCEGYDHKQFYELPIPPSPNLPNQSAIYNYPSLCFFEGTIVSVGRGTELPFQCFGFPGDKSGIFEFIPEDKAGAAIDPPYENQKCLGHNVQAFGEFYFPSNKKLYLNWLIDEYRANPEKKDFFSRPEFFDKLMGNSSTRALIVAGKTEEEIRNSWAKGLESYIILRKKYLLYDDFE